jgi:hypothetical protein
VGDGAVSLDRQEAAELERHGQQGAGASALRRGEPLFLSALIHALSRRLRRKKNSPPRR